MGRQVGSIGHIGCFSFTPPRISVLVVMVVLLQLIPAIAAKIRMLSEHGSQGRYIYEIGINSRWMPQAAILKLLRYLDTWNEQRQAIARFTTSCSALFRELSHPRIS